jgi:CelD/BcsL family acetyltransferase involved in cellulose biosynthesis
VSETRTPDRSGAVLDPLGDPRWSAFVDRAAGANIFHHPAWLRVIHERYHYPVAACTVLGADGSVVAGLPMALVRTPLGRPRLVAFPFSDACPPLGASGDIEALGRVVEQVRGASAPRWRCAAGSTRPLARGPGRATASTSWPLGRTSARSSGGFRRSSVLRGVRRARRGGLLAERRRDVEALDSFFRLHVATRSRLGAPTRPRRFIRDLAGLFADDLGFVLLVARGADVAAAAVFLHHGGVLTYKYGASDARALPMRPNNLLFWEAIRWGCDNGIEQLDLGRSEVGQESLREFKRSWGADEQELGYTHLGRERRAMPTAACSGAHWRRACAARLRSRAGSPASSSIDTPARFEPTPKFSPRARG